MSRRQLVDTFEHRQRRIDHAQREVLIERREIHLRLRRLEREQSLDLRCARESMTAAAVVQRLLAEMIARREQPAALRVPQHKCKHPAQVPQQIVAVPLVKGENHFAVAAGAECVADLAFQSLAMLLVIVDFAVADQPDGAVGVGERLVTAGEIDDGETSMTERGEGVVMNALSVGTAMAQSTQHALDELIASGIVADDGRDAAHESRQFLSWSSSYAARRCGRDRRVRSLR